MRSALTIAFLFFACLFLSSMVTPEPGDVQGYESTAPPASVEGDLDVALCNSPAAPGKREVRLACLLLVNQVFPGLMLSVSNVLYRAPPVLPLLP